MKRTLWPNPSPATLCGLLLLPTRPDVGAPAVGTSYGIQGHAIPFGFTPLARRQAFRLEPLTAIEASIPLFLGHSRPYSCSLYVHNPPPDVCHGLTCLCCCGVDTGRTGLCSGAASACAAIGTGGCPKDLPAWCSPRFRGIVLPRELLPALLDRVHGNLARSEAPRRRDRSTPNARKGTGRSRSRKSEN